MSKEPPKYRFHAFRRMSATHIGAHRTRQWNERWRSTWTHPGAYFISFFMTHFQAATTIGLRDRRFSLHPTVVLNAYLWNKWPADDAAGGNSTWLGNKIRVIGAAGKSGRHLWPLVNMGGGGGGQVMLVAGREKVHFHGMPDRINNHAQRSRREGTSRRGDRCSCQMRCTPTQNVRTPPSSVNDSTLPLTPLTFQLTPLTPLTLQLAPLTLQLTPLTLQLTTLTLQLPPRNVAITRGREPPPGGECRALEQRQQCPHRAASELFKSAT